MRPTPQHTASLMAQAGSSSPAGPGTRSNRPMSLKRLHERGKWQQANHEHALHLLDVFIWLLFKLLLTLLPALLKKTHCRGTRTFERKACMAFLVTLCEPEGEGMEETLSIQQESCDWTGMLLKSKKHLVFDRVGLKHVSFWSRTVTL
jgi:hypothetical protein